VRASNPQVKITVVGDSKTQKALEAVRHPLLKEVDEFQVVDVEADSPHFTNRFIKTSLRQCVEGPFLFLDADTLVRGDLTPIFQINSATASVAKHSGSGDPR
jgi:hypothetical protein